MHSIASKEKQTGENGVLYKDHYSQRQLCGIAAAQPRVRELKKNVCDREEKAE